MDNDALKELLQTPEPAGLGTGVQTWRAERVRPQKGAETRGQVRPCPPKKKNSSGLDLLWHYHLDAAHTIAQDSIIPMASFVHGIMHRREPDYGKCKYWFRRVGDHPVFAEIRKSGHGLE